MGEIVKNIKNGGVQVAVWRNVQENRVYFNITISRQYQDKAGEWKQSNSFGFGDIDNIVLGLVEAHKIISDELKTPAPATPEHP